MKPILLIILVAFSLIVFIQKDETMQDKFKRDYTIALSDSNSKLNGQYFLDTENILIYTKGNYIWYIEETFYHELGHLVFFRDFNESQRTEWEILYNNSVSFRFLNNSEKIELMSNGSSTFVSYYAETNPSQDFSESFSAFKLDWQKLDFKKEIFMRKYLKNG